MWVEFVVGSRPCSERFSSGYSGSPLSSKTNMSKFHFDLCGGSLVYHLCFYVCTLRLNKVDFFLLIIIRLPLRAIVSRAILSLL